MSWDVQRGACLKPYIGSVHSSYRGGDGVSIVDPCHIVVGKTGLVVVMVQGAPAWATLLPLGLD